jgi:excinuclease ABC subunit A
VVVIEHNLEVIKTADWILDMGPEGGDGGGQLLFAGTPEALVSANIGFTGPYLKPYLAPLVKSRARALVCPSLL